MHNKMFDENSNLQYGQKVNLSDRSYALSQGQEGVAINQPQKGKKIFFIVFFLSIVLLFSGIFVFWYCKGYAMYLAYKMDFPWGIDFKNYSIENTSQIIIPRDSINEFIFAIDKKNLTTQEQSNQLESIDLKSYINILDKDIEINASAKLENDQFLEIILKYFYNDSIYVKADLSKILPIFQMSDKWIYLSLDQSGSLLESSLPINKINKYFSSSLIANTKIGKDIKIIKYINISDPHESKEYNGEKLKKINFNIKKGKSQDFIFYLMKNILSEEEYNNVYKKYENSKAKNDDEFKKNAELLNNLENNINFSFWINKKTKIIREIDYSVDLDISNISFLKNQNKLKANISFINNSIFNELHDYKIEKPVDLISLEEVFASFLNGMRNSSTSTNQLMLSSTSTAQELSPNVLGDSDNDSLLDIYESLYNSDPKDPDTDKDGYMDGNEVLYGYNPNGKNSSDKLIDDRNIFYFAYGSNMDLEKMIARCGKNNFVGFKDSYLNDFKFYFYNRGYANIKPQKSSIVYGVLYKINDDCLNALDKAEGYPNLYQRQVLKIINPVGDFDSELYIVKNDNSIGSPSKSYFNTVINGASQYSLPANYVKENFYTTLLLPD